MSKIRTFIAVNLSSKIRTKVGRLIDRMANTRAEYRWVEEDNLHVTLNFVGDVPENEVADLCRAVKKKLDGFERFALSVHGSGAFPNTEKPKTIWLGIEEGADELKELYSLLEELLVDEWRFPKDRNEFRPHLTVGRLRRGGRWNQALTNLIEEHDSQDFGMCSVDEVVVNSSHLEKSGPTYTPMVRVKLV